MRGFLSALGLIAALLIGQANAQFFNPALYFPSPAGGGGTCCTLVNKGYGEDTSGSAVANISIASAINVTAGNLLVVGCRNGTTTNNPTSVTDTAGNTFTLITGANPGAAGRLTVFYAKNVTGNASDIPRCNYSPSEAYQSVSVIQYSGASTTAPLDTSATGTNGAGTSVVSGTFTTATAKEVLVANCTAGALNIVFGSGAGYTVETTSQMSATADDIVTATQSGVTATCSDTTATSHNDWAIVVATFK
jgi:hypothetical protein